MMQINRVLVTIFLLIFVAACSNTTDKSLYESAKQKITEGDYQAALADFKTLSNDFPESNYLAAVKFEMGKMYQGFVVPNISKSESLNEAVKFYTDVYESYPDSMQAVNALFMIAFLQANELKNLDAAKDAYVKFIERYPDHELAVSARAELDNLGKSPEEILQEKINQK
ncbi:MAG: tetratricopeptide repeat protein [Bacteroidetes bacterium]|nr:tetratricopeptide repeat protein [Bacteroidota bacterium]